MQQNLTELETAIIDSLRIHNRLPQTIKRHLDPQHPNKKPQGN